MTPYMLLQTSAPAAASYALQPLGWAFMLTSLGLVLALTAFCYYRVLSKPGSADHMHAPLDIDTRDRGT